MRASLHTSGVLSAPAYVDGLRDALTSVPDYQRLFGTTVLVTGATGMLCSPVVDLLILLNEEMGANISILVAGRDRSAAEDRFGPFSGDNGLEFVQFDATDSASIASPKKLDYIIHGASNANPSAYMAQPVETMLANIVGLSAMLDVAREFAGSRILYVSSSEVYGKTANNEPFTEDEYGYLDILDRRASYPSSKRAGESLCVAYGIEYGVDAVIVRPGHIYGPTTRESDNRASAQFTRTALAGDDVVMNSAGTQLRSYCYALDCASALLTVLLNGESDNAYNISNSQSICSISDIAKAIAAAAGVAMRNESESLGGSALHNLMDNSSLNSAKLEALGWTPRFSLNAGVAHMVDVLRHIG